MATMSVPLASLFQMIFQTITATKNGIDRFNFIKATLNYYLVFRCSIVAPNTSKFVRIFTTSQGDKRCNHNTCPLDTSPLTPPSVICKVPSKKAFGDFPCHTKTFSFIYKTFPKFLNILPAVRLTKGTSRQKIHMDLPDKCQSYHIFSIFH